MNSAWMNDVPEEGNYHIWVYLSFIEHKRHWMVCRPKHTFIGWFDTKVNFKDLKIEYYTRGYLRLINNKFRGVESCMLDGQEAHLYTMISSLHDLPSNQLSCLCQVSSSRCSPLKGGIILQSPSYSCDLHWRWSNHSLSLSLSYWVVAIYRLFSKGNQILVMVCFQAYG